jgi:signal transduction histidine kinase
MIQTKTRRSGIMLRIALLTWLITLVTVLVFVVVIIPDQKRIFVENLNSKANAVALAVCNVATWSVVNEDYTTLVEHCLQVLKEDKSIDYLVITKNSGESWIHDKSGWRYSKLPPAWHPENRVAGGDIGVVPNFNRRVFHYSRPFDYSGIHWGWVHVGLSLDTYDQNVAAVYRRTGILAFVCILLSFLASGFYARFLVRPIMNLQSVVDRIKNGDLSARAAIKTGDEIELLADSFNAMADSLLQRNNILGGVQFASQQLLAASDWRTVAVEVLTRIGKAAEICRAYVFENRVGPDGTLLAGELFEYSAPSEARLIRTAKEPEFAWEKAGWETLSKCLKEGRVFTALVRDLNAAEKVFFAAQKAQSVILVPIWIEGAWWGHLEFDDCTRERVWTAAEIDSLRALADMLGAAIAKQRVQDALLKSKLTLEQRVSERTRELQEQVSAKEKALSELAETQQELIIASREAGMAEVATSVLHNVGNVLNSVNVSAGLIRQMMQRSKISTMSKLRDMLLQHEADMETFLTTDAKGKLVPGFVIRLSESLEKERSAMLDEYEQLARNVEHIKEIVAMQQNYARVSGFIEPVAISELLDDAVRMNIAGLTRHGVATTRQYSEVPPLTGDKHKILQILVNLVHNAKYALDESHRTDKQLTLGVNLNGGNRVKITVADNGVGIAPENLTRIFSHGFTTRKTGHGFGLHSGANAAKEMGGHLSVFSEGVGRGAIFTLELPLEAQKNSQSL